MAGGDFEDEDFEDVDEGDMQEVVKPREAQLFEVPVQDRLFGFLFKNLGSQTFV